MAKKKLKGKRKYFAKSVKALNPRKRITFYLTELDSITQVWEVDKNNACIKVITVTYHLEYKGKGYDVVRFDTEHGYLDCHHRVSIQENIDVRAPQDWIIEKGTPQDWMNWA